MAPHRKAVEAAREADYLEDRWFLIDGIFNAYSAAENEREWFNRGGFAKLQPHYARTSDLHALRDDVKAPVRLGRLTEWISGTNPPLTPALPLN